jgi:hypothetical protein
MPSVLTNPRYTYLWASLLLCTLVLTRFYWPAAHGLDVTGHQIGRDFISVWAGPKLAFSGRLSTLFDLDGYVDAISALFGQPLHFHNWGYPPFTLLLFWPFAQLPYFWALAVWTVGFFAVFAWTGVSFVGAEHRRYMLLALVCAPACIINTVGGQNGFATGALLLGGILCLQKRPILAGVLFGLLTSKPQLGLVLPFALLALRAWKTIAAACLTTALLVASSLVAFGPEPWRVFLTQTSAFQWQLLKRFSGFYTVMMSSVMAEARTLGVPFDAALSLQAVVSLTVLILATWAVTKTQCARQRAFILVSAVPLITPYGFNYDFTALSVVLTWRLIEDAPPVGSAKDLLFKLGWLAPIMLMPLNMLGIGIAPVLFLAIFLVSVSEAAGGFSLKRFGASRVAAPVAEA